MIIKVNLIYKINQHFDSTSSTYGPFETLPKFSKSQEKSLNTIIFDKNLFFDHIIKIKSVENDFLKVLTNVRTHPEELLVRKF